MIRLRACLALCLGLALGVASVSLATARADMALARQMVICTGMGVTSVALDARGRPIGPVHPCPNCLAGQMAADVPPAPVLPLRSLGAAEVLLPAAQPHAVARPSVPALARGPPSLLS